VIRAVVDAAGNPLTGVYLFDQDGRAIDTSGSFSCEDDLRFGESAASAARPYPRGTTDYDPRTSDCVTIPPGPLLVAVPSATLQPTSTSSTTAAPPSAPAVPPSPVPSAGPPVPPAPPVVLPTG
jgi:hypothetical protein